MACCLRSEQGQESCCRERPKAINTQARWTAWEDAIIIEQYNAFNQLRDECFETWPDPDIKGRMIGVQTQMIIWTTA